ncbi:Thioredoxin [Rhynchospora pubera]|uniref:Thioredoxin n=1 Tax=Rhynchospora pubera TaxID=906938 RepID=A0AAV8G8C2_9POAL|nr:Thioredoxin [Rhynchospora pubera]
MAATILESLAIPCSRPGLSTSVTSGRSAAAPLATLPQFKGLRASPCRQIAVSARSTARSRSIRRRDVVCEVQGQEAALSVPDVTKSTWQSMVLESDLPVLVEFWASWCGPCKMIDPVVGKLSKEYEGKIRFYKINTDDNPDIATQYGIRSIPTMMIFKNGEKKDAVIGAVPEGTLVSCIDKFV